MKNVQVKAAIDALVEERLAALGVTSLRVLEEISRLGFSNTLDYIRITDDGQPIVDFSTVTREQAAAIQEVTSETIIRGSGEDAQAILRTKFKLGDKKGSLELLGKYLKLFTEKREYTGRDGAPMQHQHEVNQTGTPVKLTEGILDTHERFLEEVEHARSIQDGGAGESGGAGSEGAADLDES